MGKRKIVLPNSPKKWAIHLSKMLTLFHAAHPDTHQFPIDVAKIAIDYSKSVFPQEPITLVQGADFSNAFEGALIPNPNKNSEWAILYNQSIQSKGRINFTLAHELGHYLSHRHLLSEGKKCSKNDMLLHRQSQEMIIENEANIFASHLLMPTSNFSKDMHNTKISRNLISNLADKYGVSMSAAALRWINLTKEQAMLISSKEGFIDWAWSNEKLLKSGIYYAPKKHIIELPANSLAMESISNETERLLPAGAWIGSEEVKEISLYNTDEYSLILLIYPPKNKTGYEESETDDLLEEIEFD